ncbi:MAG TPA: D-2-hydroxyacid dehydrogenase [Chloroflexota bacterium]
MVKVVMMHSSPERLKWLRDCYPQAQLVAPSSRAEGLPDLADADVVFGALTNEEFQAARNVRWIQASSAGVEFMWRIPSIVEHPVVVTNARGAHAATIAEHTFALLLGLARQIVPHHHHQQQHRWSRGDFAGKLTGLKGLTMGVVGFGNIGKSIGRRALGFEMNVLAVDAQPVPSIEGVEDVWSLGRLDELCRASDVLAIAAPITPETRGMIGAEQIKLMRPGSFVVAVSRGGIVDEPALIEALESGHLAGAGLDVTATEPLPADSPLWDAPNILITPHDSGASKLTTDLMWSIFHENLGRYLRGETLTNLVDKKLGY